MNRTELLAMYNPDNAFRKDLIATTLHHRPQDNTPEGLIEINFHIDAIIADKIREYDKGWVYNQKKRLKHHWLMWKLKRALKHIPRPHWAK